MHFRSHCAGFDAFKIVGLQIQGRLGDVRKRDCLSGSGQESTVTKAAIAGAARVFYRTLVTAARSALIKMGSGIADAVLVAACTTVVRRR
jgi:hypothetical protein